MLRAARAAAAVSRAAVLVSVAATVAVLVVVVGVAVLVVVVAMSMLVVVVAMPVLVLAVALFQTSKGFGLLQSFVYALGAGAGFTLALVLMAGLREQLEFSETIGIVKGTALVLLVGGILSLSFMGFAGLGG